MSTPAPASRRRQFAVVGLIFALSPLLPAPALGATRDDSAAPRTSADAVPARTMLIARVLVNTVPKGDIAILRDANGRTYLPLAEFRRWLASPPGAVPVTIDGESWVDVSAIPGVEANFDPATVTLSLRLSAGALPATRIDLGPERRPDVIFPAEDSFFLNYGFDAAGDDTFNQRQYVFATELAARSGSWLFYNTTSQQWGSGAQGGFVRLLTNLQQDDRPNLRRWTFGDFFTPSFDLNASVPLGGVSLSKLYSMDPYFVQYPTAAFATEVAFPSTVQVRMDGNLVAQRQVQPGPVNIANITNGLTGGQNVAVVIRDPFGREQTLQQPFFFATEAGLAAGLHEYSYNVGFLRRNYGVESGDYGDVAASAFHRYAFTNQLTLGLRGQASDGLYNIGAFGTYQSPLGILGIGAAIGGRDGATGPATTVAYSYTGTNFSVNLGSLYRSRDYAQLTDLLPEVRVRSSQYASGSVYFPDFGTLTATYNGLNTFDGPDARIVNLTYTRSMLAGKGLLALNYVRTLDPQSTHGWLLSFRYFFDSTTSAVAAVGGSSGGNTQALSLQKSLPQGEGLGYELTVGRVEDHGTGAMFGRALVQANAEHVAAGAEYMRASRSEGGPGLARVFVAGSIGGVGGRVFAARPVQDSFALVRIPDTRDVPVYANGWFVGNTNASGEVVATNVASYYDNFISFATRELPLDYVFPTSEIVISPATRSGSLVTFTVRRNRAIVGRLVELRDGQSSPLEFREVRLVRGETVIRSFTARRGEFYVDGVEPGEYVIDESATGCSARLSVPDLQDAVTDIGTAVCQRVPR